jgi:hypothetical protein
LNIKRYIKKTMRNHISSEDLNVKCEFHIRTKRY